MNTPESALTRYRMTWSRADGTGETRTVECFVDSTSFTGRCALTPKKAEQSSAPRMASTEFRRVPVR